MAGGHCLDAAVAKPPLLCQLKLRSFCTSSLGGRPATSCTSPVTCPEPLLVTFCLCRQCMLPCLQVWAQRAAGSRSCCQGVQGQVQEPGCKDRLLHKPGVVSRPCNQSPALRIRSRQACLSLGSFVSKFERTQAGHDRVPASSWSSVQQDVMSLDVGQLCVAAADAHMQPNSLGNNAWWQGNTCGCRPCRDANAK